MPVSRISEWDSAGFVFHSLNEGRDLRTVRQVSRVSCTPKLRGQRLNGISIPSDECHHSPSAVKSWRGIRRLPAMHL
jgi:hypothetical protein